MSGSKRLPSYPEISFAPDGSFAVAWSYIDVFWEQDPYYGTVSQVFGAEHNVVEFFTSDGVSKGLPQEVPGRQPDVAFDPAGNAGVAYFELSPSQSDPTLQNVSGISVTLASGQIVNVFTGTQAGFGPDEWEQAFTELRPNFLRARWQLCCCLVLHRRLLGAGSVLRNGLSSIRRRA